MRKEYYIISLKHTNKTDSYLTLWRADNAGYCISKELAGIYTEIQEGYHNSEGQLPIECKELDKLMILTSNEDKKEFNAVPNCAAIHRILGVKYKKYELIKI